MASEKKPTKQQKEFCREYIKNGLNGSQAYLKAYAKTVKTEVSARTNAYRLLQQEHIQIYISKLQADLEKKSIISIEERQRWLTDIFIGKETEEYVDKNGDVVLVSVNMANRLKALDILNKMNGAYSNNINLDINAGVNIKIIPEEDD